MNKIFRVIWNAATQSWVAVSELSRVKTKSASSVDKRPTLIHLSKIAVATGAVLGSGFATAALSWQDYDATQQSSQMSMGYVDNGAPNSVAIGVNVTTRGTGGSVAIGYNVHTDYNFDGNGKASFGTTSIGYNTSALGNFSVALGADAHANGETSMAIGRNSCGTGFYDIAIGKDAATSGQYALALGAGANASGINSMAIGLNTIASGSDSVAYGARSCATGIAAIALGRWANASGQDNIAIGDAACATNSQSVAIGWQAKAQGNNDIALGYDAQTKENAGRNIIIGEATRANGYYGTAIGPAATTGGVSKYTLSNITTEQDGVKYTTSTIAIGRASKATETRAVALGREAVASDLASYAVGFKANSSGVYSNVFGSESQVSGNGTTAVGNWITEVTGEDSQVFGSNVSSVSANYATVIGSNINSVTKDGGVVLGNASSEAPYVKPGDAQVTTDASDVFTYSSANWAGITDLQDGDYVSFGSAGKERQLKNVAAGCITAESTDAINGSQLYYITTQMPHTVVKKGSGSGTVTTEVNGTTGYKDYVINFPTVNPKPWYLNITNSEADLALLADSNYEELLGKNVRAGLANSSKKGISVEANEEVQFVPLDNMEIYQRNRVQYFRVSMDPQFNTTQISNGQNSVNFNVTPGRAGGLTLSNATGSPVTITGVANGTISPTSTQAINGSQLYSTIKSGLNFIGNDNKATAIHKDIGQTLAVLGGVAVANKDTTSNINTYVDNNGTALIVKIKKNPEFEGVTLNTSGTIVNLTTNGTGLVVGDRAGNPTKIQNVAAGTEDNDAVNFAQLKANITTVTSDDGSVSVVETINSTGRYYDLSIPSPKTGWNFTTNGDSTNLSTVNANQPLDLSNTDGTINITHNGNNITFNSNLSPLSVSDGSNSSNPTADDNNVNKGAITVPQGDAGKALVNASTIATAINSAFWTVNSTTAGGEDSYTPSDESQISAGDEVFINAGKNINITGAGNVLNISTVDNPTFTSVTIGNASNPVTIGTDANGNNTVANLTANLPKTNTMNLTNAGDQNVGNTASDGSTTPFTTNVARPTLTDGQENNAATVGDVLNAGWNLQENSVAKDFVKPYDTINFVNSSTVAVNVTSDGNLSNVTWSVITSSLNVSDGSNSSNPTANDNNVNEGAITVPQGDAGSALVNASTIAETINKAFWTVNSTSAGGESGYTKNKDSQISAGDVLNINAGKNINISGAGNTLNISTVENPTFTNVTIGGNDANSNTPITIGTDANGNNTIANLTANLPKTNTMNLTNAGDQNVGNTNSTGNTTPFTTNVERPTLTDGQENNAATVGDVLNAGWNLQENSVAKDFVKPYDTINFVNSSTVAVNVTSDGNLSNVTWSVITSSLNVSDGSNSTNPTANDNNTNEGAITVPQGDAGSSLVNASTVAETINKAFWTVNSTSAGGKSGYTKNKDSQISAGDVLNINAGKNINISGAGNTLNISTVDNPTFTNVTIGGNDANSNTPITIGTDANGNNTIANLTANLPKTNTMNLTNAGDQNVGNTNSTGNTTPFTTNVERPTLADGQENNAATLGDVLNAGWNLQENSVAKDFVKPYDTINFVNSSTVAVNVTSDGNLSNVTWNVKTSTLDVSDGSNAGDANATTNNTNEGAISVPKGDAGSALVNASTIAETINKAFWTVNSTSAGGKSGYTKNKDSQISAGDVLNINAGKNINISGAGNTLNISTVENPTFTNVTIGGNDANSNTPITIGTDANGNNTIANLTANLPKTNTENLTNVGDQNIGNTASDGSTTPFTTNVARPTLTDGQENNAATVGDVLNAGWNLQANGQASDFVKPYDTINFANGSGTSVNITSNGNVSTITIDIAKAGVVTNTNTSVAGNTSTNTPEAGKASVANGTGNNYVTGDTLVEAINNSGWKVTSDITGTGERAGANATTELVQPGETVKFIAGDNLQITQDGQNFTYATKKDVTFSTVNVTDKLNVGNITVTPEGVDMANNRIINLAPGVNATDAVNVAQLPKVQAGKNITITNVTGANGETIYTINSNGSGSANPWNLTTNGDTNNASTVGSGDDNVDLSNQDGNINITHAGNNVSFNLNSTTTLGGKDGVNGKDGKDGALVIRDANGTDRIGLNGKDGSIGINGKDGANASISVGDRQTTIDAGDAGNNITRIIYNATRPVVDADGNPVKDADGNPVTETVERQVATMDDGLVFAGDKGESPRKLGSTLKVYGGETNYSNVSTNPNVGVFANATTGELEVRLAKKIDLGNNSKVQTGNVSISSEGIDAGNHKVVNVSNGTISPTSKDAVNGSQLYAVQSEVEKGWNVTTSKSGTGHVEGTTLANVKMGSTVTVDAGNNINITQSGRNVSIATSMRPTFNTVTATDSVTIGQGNTAVNLSNDDAGNLVINKGGNAAQIKNVKAGTADTDAVNVSQLKGVANNVNIVNNKVDKLDKRVRGIGASAAAAASLPQVYIPGKSMVAAAAGGYGGKSAIAVGYSRASDNGKLILKLQGTANSAGHYSGGVGVGYQW